MRDKSPDRAKIMKEYFLALFFLVLIYWPHNYKTKVKVLVLSPSYPLLCDLWSSVAHCSSLNAHLLLLLLNLPCISVDRRNHQRKIAIVNFKRKY